MKKVKAETTSVICILLLCVIGILAFGQLAFCLISPTTVMEWLKNAHVAYYSAATAVNSKFMAYIMNQSFLSMFSEKYIRIMSMYIFVLCVPLMYGLINIYLISQNGQGEKPFRASTAKSLRMITISFAGEFLLATVLFAVLKSMMKALPFYFMYTMLAVALYSLTMVVFSMTIRGLINRMGELRSEKKKQIQAAKQQAPTASVEADVKAVLKASTASKTEPVAPAKKHRVSTDFDDVLGSLDD